ncbi:MAG TPA: branched-chain amino acid ABC transporter permease [bacterium]|nr:branched-chain amino acid ABC transporter permease [bacterium]
MILARLAGWLVLVAIGVALPHVVYPALAVDILAWALFATAFDLLLGHTGLLSFGHAAYFGAGAYVSGILAARAGTAFPLNVLAGGAAAGVLAVPLMALGIRRTGIYFAMITLALAQMVYYIANAWRDMTGGENGVTGIPHGSLFGASLASSTSFYYAALPIVALGVVFCWRIVRSPFGRVLVAIRENEARAESLGYDTARYKLMAAILSTALAGVAGGIWAINHSFVALDAVHWSTSGTVVIMTLLGGMGTRLGPLVGAGLVLILRDAISSWTDAWGVVTGAIFVGVILAFRHGIVGTLERMLSARAAPASSPTPPTVEGPAGS